LRDGELRARVHLPVEPGELTVQLHCAGVHADADRPAGGAADRVVAGVESVVEPIHQVREPDRVDVENGRGLGVGAHLGRIAGDDKDVAQPGRVRAGSTPSDGTISTLVTSLPAASLAPQCERLANGTSSTPAGGATVSRECTTGW